MVSQSYLPGEAIEEQINYVEAKSGEHEEGSLGGGKESKVLSPQARPQVGPIACFPIACFLVPKCL